MKCEKCGFDAPDERKFCGKCGATMPESSPPSLASEPSRAQKLKRCSACGTKSHTSYAYCPNCGHSFMKGVRPTASQKPPKSMSSFREKFPSIYDEIRDPSETKPRNLFRLLYSPRKTMASLYRSASPRGSLMLMGFALICEWSIASLIFRSDVQDYAQYFFTGFCYRLLVVAMIAALPVILTRIWMRRKGDFVATLTIGGYIEASLGIVMILGAILFMIVDWLTASETLPWIAYLAVAIPFALYGIYLWSSAIGLANDISDSAAGWAFGLGVFGAVGMQQAIHSIIFVPLGVTSASFFVPLPF